jgi:hypothetical protein
MRLAIDQRFGVDLPDLVGDLLQREAVVVDLLEPLEDDEDLAPPEVGEVAVLTIESMKSSLKSFGARSSKIFLLAWIVLRMASVVGRRP